MGLLSNRTLVVADAANQLQRYRSQRLSPEKCLLGVEFLTLDRLIRLVAEQSVGPVGILPPQTVSRIMADAVVDVVGNAASPAWSTPGVLRQILDAVTELRLTRLLGDEPPAAPGYLADIRHAFETRLDERRDIPGMALLLADNLTRPPSERPPILRDATSLVLIGAPAEDTWRGRLFTRLRDAYADAECPDDYGDASATGLFTGEVCAVLSGTTRTPPDGLTIDSPSPSDIRFRRFSSAECELRSVARDIRRTLADGTPPADILVIAPPGLYTRRLPQVLDDYGIPHDVAATGSLAESPLGQLVLFFLHLDPDRIAWHELLTICASPVIATGRMMDGAGGLSPRSIARLLREHRLRTATLDDWSNALPAIRTRLSRRADAAQADDDEHTAERLRTQVSRLETGEAAFHNLIESVRSIVPGRHSRTLAEWGAWIENLLYSDTLGTRETAAIRDLDERAVRSAMLEIAVEQQQAPGGSELSVETYTELLAAVLHATSRPLRRPTTTCVAARTPEQVEPCLWPRVYVVGMNEGVLPAHTVDGGIVDDEMRRAHGLEPLAVADRRAEQRLLEILRRAGDTLWLSFAAGDATGRAQLPSILLQRLQTILIAPDANGQRVSVFLPDGKAGDDAYKPWCITEPPDVLIPDADTATTPAEAALVEALTDDADGAAVDAPVSVMRDWWDTSRWQPHSKGPLQAFGPVDITAGLTPSRLDAFGHCPYRYFAEHELGLSEPRTPELTPDALETGNALHGALETAISTIIDESGPDWFVCANANEQQIRIEELERRVNTHLVDGFVALHRLDSSAALIHDKVRQRWQRTLRATLHTSLVRADAISDIDPQLDALESDIIEKIEKRRSGKKAVADEMAGLLAECQAARAIGNVPDILASMVFPRGFKGSFDDLAGALEKRKEALREGCVPVLCEWTIGDRNDPVRVDLGDGEQLRLRGKLDRVDLNKNGPVPKLRICDYKSGMTLATENDIKSGISLQLPAYALACHSRIEAGELPPELRRHLGGETPQLQDVLLLGIGTHGRSGVDATAEELERFRTQLRQVRDHIVEGRLPPLPQKGCPVRTGYGFCKLAALCRCQTIPEAWFDQPSAVAVPDAPGDDTP